MKMTVSHLRPFVTVAQRGSITKASRALNRAQSAVTRSILELEHEIGEPLFERSNQGVLLTAFGRTLLRRTHRALQEMDTARDELVAAAAKVSMHAPIFSLSIGVRRLLALTALADQRHMGSVASTLGISQSAVSQSIRQIESSLGLQLFERSIRGVRPNNLGSILSFYVKRALSELRIAEDEIVSLGSGPSGQIIVGALLGRTTLLPEAALQIIAQHPNLSVSIIEGSFEMLVSSLRAGDVDFVLGTPRSAATSTDITCEIVAHDTMVAIVRSGHPFLQRKGVTLAELASAQWVLTHRNTSTRALLEDVFSRHGLGPPRVAVETANSSIIR